MASRRRRRTGRHRELNGVKLMAKLTQKKKEGGELGSGKPYDKCSEMEAALDIPVAS